jgi:hypothetical protein
MVKSLLLSIRHVLSDRLRKIDESWWIFLTCLLVYSVSTRVSSYGLTLTSPDSTPNSLLGLNWLIHGRLDFDNFRQGIYYNGDQLPYFFVETKSGHLSSLYPIGSAILSFPVYVCIYLFLLVSHGFHAIDITSSAFSAQRLVFERFAAAVISGFAVVLFYQLSRLKFDRAIALISTFIYAFATHAWAINSQALWQHGSTNLILMALMLCLFKANRAQDLKPLFILNAGILCGLLMSIRPTNLTFMLPIVVYAIAIHRRQAVFLGLGLSSLLIPLSWNLYYFRSLTGGYGTFREPFTFTLEQFIAGFTGLLFSPSRGLLVYTPILLVTIPGIIQICRHWRQKDEKLLILLLLGCIPLFLQYCFFRMWWAGGSYGPRFLTDTLPMLCFSMNYAIAFCKFNPLKVLAVSGLLILSLWVQVVGVLGACAWDNIPTVIEYDHYSSGLTDREGKLWQLRDSQIERHTLSLIFQLKKPTSKPNYFANLSGEITQLRDRNQKPLPKTISIPVGGILRVRATVKNTGKSRWFGYQTGASQLGEARVQVVLQSPGQQNLPEHRLFISGEPKRGQTAEALGDITFPQKAGIYTVRLFLFAEGLGRMASGAAQFEAIVTPIDQRY